MSQTLKSSNPDPTLSPTTGPSTASVAKNLIVNGNFFKPFCDYARFCSYRATESSLLAPWAIVFYDFPYFVVFPPSYAGYRALYLNSTMVIQQIVPTTVGSAYQLRLSIASMPAILEPTCNTSLTETGYVTATGGLNQTFSISDSATQQMSYVFRANWSAVKC